MKPSFEAGSSNDLVEEQKTYDFNGGHEALPLDQVG